jgi:hypothetical protein
MEIKKEIIYNEDDDDERYSFWKFLLVPGCCRESIAARRPYLYLNFGRDTGEVEVVDDATPEWRVPNLEWDLISKLADYDEEYDSIKAYEKTCVPVKFCPFCGKKVPEVRRKENPPAPVHSDADGGYYCGTCDERNMSCGCLPMTALFEVVDE